MKRWRRFGDWLAGAVCGAIVGAMAQDCVFNHCGEVRGLFDYSGGYAFQLTVGNGKDGIATSNYATPLFSRYEEQLREAGKTLDFRPPETKRMLFCFGFGREEGSVEQVVDKFFKRYSLCVRKTSPSDQDTVTVVPAWGESDLALGESGQLWCRCAQKVIQNEEKSFTRAPESPGNGT